MQIKEKMAEEMGYEVLHGIVDCLWVIGEGLGRSGVCLYEVADK